MSGTSSDPQKGTDGFDPYRRRREIELMEQKFRERAERSGGGPVATNEIDRRVADEMKQFFSESAEKAAKVVPALEERPGNGMRETTGEIRRKIDDFFSQVKDAGGGEAAPNTQELAARRPRWQGFIPPAPGSAPAAPSSAVSSAHSSSGDPPRPNLVRTAPPGQQNVPPPVGQHAGRISVLGLQQTPARQAHPAPAPAPAAHPVATPSAEPDAQKMDLRTALERLRRHGVVRPEGGGPAPAGGPGASASPAQSAAPSTPAPAAAAAPSASIASARPLPARPASPPPAAIAAPATPRAPASAAPAPAAPAAPAGRPVSSLPAAVQAGPPAAPAPAPVPSPSSHVPPVVSATPAAMAPPVHRSSSHASPGASLGGGPGASRGQTAFVPPRREPTVRGLPSLRPDVTPSPGTGPVPMVPPRREPTRPVPVLRADAPVADSRSAAPAASQRGQSAAEPGRPHPVAEPSRTAPPPESANRSVARPSSPDDEDSGEILPRPRFVPSAAAAQRAAAVKKARLDPRASLPSSAVDRRLPPMPQEDDAPPEPEDRRPESPIRVVKQRSVVDVESSTVSDEAPSRRPSAAAQAFAARFNKGSPRESAGPAEPAEPPRPPVKPSPSPRAAAVPDPGQAFDAIFDELQGLVIDTLRSSVDESFEVARAVEDEMRISQPISGPVSLPSAPAPTPVPASARSVAAPVPAPSAPAGARPQPEARATPEFRPSQEPRPAGEPRAVPDSRQVPSAPPSRPAVPPATPAVAPPVAAQTPAAASFDRPAEDAEDEIGEDDAPGSPYDWGVRKAPRPQGAWLVEGQEKGLESLRRPAGPQQRAAQAPAAPVPAPAPSAPSAAAPSAAAPAAESSPAASGGAGGARGYLVRKLGDEVKKFQPALDALQAKGVIRKSDLDDPDDAPAAGKDDMVSIEQYRERKPVDLEKELSPVRVVAELRRIRRLMDALLARGLITEADLQKQDEED